jgi:hypothetical protein
MGVPDAGALSQLAGDQRDLRFAQSEYVDFDMKNVVGAEFGQDAAGNYIEIPKTAENARDRTRISVSRNPKTEKSKWF